VVKLDCWSTVRLVGSKRYSELDSSLPLSKNPAPIKAALMENSVEMVSTSVGAAVGEELGGSEMVSNPGSWGALEGAGVGNAVGALVGLAVGLEVVGEEDGALVGDAVGVDVGVVVGVSVGAEVGVSVGAAELAM